MTAGTFTVEELIDEGVLAPPMDGNHGSIHPKTVDYVETGIPFVMASDLVSGRVDTTNCAFLSDDQANSLRKGFSKTGDVLLSHKATIGRTAIVGRLETDFIMLTPQITYYRVLDEDRLDRRYLYYYFNSRPFQELLGQWAGAGSTRAYLGITGQRKLPIVVPEPSVQKDIVGRLGALDDKIELNRRMNETLEEMARALFRDWFVDFGPTRRQIEGATDPTTIMGHAFPPEKAATLTPLFPAKLGDDGTPEGWETGCIGDLFTLQRGFDLPTNARLPGAFPVIAAGGVHGSHNEAKVTGPGVVTGRSGVIGEVQYVPSDYWPLNTTLWVKEFKRSAPFHCYFFLQTLDLKSINSGSAVPSLNRNHVHAMATGIPAEVVISEFDLFASTLFKKIEANEQENQTLAEMRDLLLPKLMSGEIRLKDAKIQTEAVL